jgi:hypothetical protein
MVNKLLVFCILLNSSISLAEISIDSWIDSKNKEPTKLQISCNGTSYMFKVNNNDIEKSEQIIIEWFDDIKKNKCKE